MKTENLNEFQFAALVEKQAKIDKTDDSPITNYDLKEACDHLIQLRLQVLDILENSEDLERPNNTIKFKPKK
jgi:hypothetical protein